MVTTTIQAKHPFAKSQVGFNDLIEATLLIKAGWCLTQYPHPPQAACYISRPQRWRKWAKMPWNSAFKSLTLGWGHLEAIHSWEGSAHVIMPSCSTSWSIYSSSVWKGHRVFHSFIKSPGFASPDTWWRSEIVRVPQGLRLHGCTTPAAMNNGRLTVGFWVQRHAVILCHDLCWSLYFEFTPPSPRILDILVTTRVRNCTFLVRDPQPKPFIFGHCHAPGGWSGVLGATFT